MKKIITLLLLIATVLSVPGCNFIKGKITDKVAEKLIENAAGEDVNVDIDEDKMVINGEDGSEMVIGGTEWPAGIAGQTIPEFKDGKIESVADYGTSAIISISDVTKKEYDSYIEKLKTEGFTENTYSGEQDGTYTFLAYKTDTVYVSVSLDSNGEFIITAATE
jgi:predicted small secreted protein